MKYTVVTTFHEAGYRQYGSRMIDTWLANWPQSVQLWVYAENCHVDQQASNLRVLDTETTCPDLVRFKSQWSGVAKATGDISGDPIRGLRRDSKKSFKWDAVRFSHKVYSIFHAAQSVTTPWLIWMDADMVCHGKMTTQFLDTMCDDDTDLAYLGRRGKFSECGLYAIQLNTKATTRFLKEFRRMYDHAEEGIFQLPEWHDSYVFDDVRMRIPGLRQRDWSSSLGDLRRTPSNSAGEGHPLINSAWGAYLDHLKGDDRNKAGHSHAIDLKVERNEQYWSAIR